MRCSVSKCLKLATFFILTTFCYHTMNKKEEKTAVQRNSQSKIVIDSLRVNKDQTNPKDLPYIERFHKTNIKNSSFDETENVNLAVDTVRNKKKYIQDKLSTKQINNGLKTNESKNKDEQFFSISSIYKRQGAINNINFKNIPVLDYKNKSLLDSLNNERTLFNASQQTSKADTVSYESKRSLRCESKHFGCFELVRDIKKIKSSRIETDFGEKNNRENCIKYCSERKTNFAGLHHTTCYCGSDVRKFISIKNVNKCNITCTGNLKDTCGGEKSVDLYYIASPCSEESISLQNNLLGCFKSSKDFTEILDENWVSSNKKTALSCFIYCENKGYAVSGFNFFDDCICGRFSKKFNMDQKISKTNCSSFLKVNKLYSKWNMYTLYKTSAEDKRCSEMKYKYVRGPHVLLTSVPSSGNTWLRYLLEKASGFFTGSVYKDTPVFEKGYLGEMTQQTLIVKDHFYDHKFHLYNAAIFIVRNPYHTMLAEFKRQKTLSHVGEVDVETIKKDFQLYDEGTLLFLSKMLTSKKIPLYVVVYEDLVRDPIGEVKKLLTSFTPLKSIVPDEEILEDRLLCLSSQLNGYFKRKKQNLKFDPYTNEIKIKINDNISKAREVLNKAGFKIPNYEKPVL